jgi:hypothetical protein
MPEDHISKAICLEIMIETVAAIFTLDYRIEVLWDAIHLLVVEELLTKKLSSIFITKSGRSSGLQ